MLDEAALDPLPDEELLPCDTEAPDPEDDECREIVFTDPEDDECREDVPADGENDERREPVFIDPEDEEFPEGELNDLDLAETDPLSTDALFPA